MLTFQIDKYNFCVQIGDQPAFYERWLENSTFQDLEGLKNTGTPVYIGIKEDEKWQMSTIAFKTDPIDNVFFNPELLFIPETQTLFIGAGRIASTYDLTNKTKVSERSLAMGFWYWARHDDLVILVEELEIGVYDCYGRHKWSAGTEPPSSYGIKDNILTLDIMDNISTYDLETGKRIS
jgi:hypothetical protein